MGLNPVHDTCDLEQDTSIKLLHFTQGYKLVPARVKVDTVLEKAFGHVGALWQPRAISPERFQKCKAQLIVMQNALYKN